MSQDRKVKEEKFCFQNLSSWVDGLHPMVTVRVSKWFYYIPRAKLTIIEGIYNTSEEIDDAIAKSRPVEIASIRARQEPSYPIERPPRFFEVVTHPESLLQLAEAIKRVCSSQSDDSIKCDS